MNKILSIIISITLLISQGLVAFADGVNGPMQKAKLKVGINAQFPHNLRHLFARTYYSLQKDIVRLADILGHSNVNTTRIYTIEDGSTHRRQMQRMGLVRMQN